MRTRNEKREKQGILAFIQGILRSDIRTRALLGERAKVGCKVDCMFMTLSDGS